MDKLKVIHFLITDFEEQGFIDAKSAKEISEGAGLPLCETYPTLTVLQADNFIWRVGRRKLYRYGLKEGETLDYLLQLFRSIARKQPLPQELLISYEFLDAIRREIAQKAEKEKELVEKRKRVQLLQKKLTPLPKKERQEAIERVASEIASEYVISSDYDTFAHFLREKIASIREEIIGAKLTKEVE